MTSLPVGTGSAPLCRGDCSRYKPSTYWALDDCQIGNRSCANLWRIRGLDVLALNTSLILKKYFVKAVGQSICLHVGYLVYPLISIYLLFAAHVYRQREISLTILGWAYLRLTIHRSLVPEMDTTSRLSAILYLQQIVAIMNWITDAYMFFQVLR